MSTTAYMIVHTPDAHHTHPHTHSHSTPATIAVTSDLCEEPSDVHEYTFDLLDQRLLLLEGQQLLEVATSLRVVHVQVSVGDD